MFRWIWRQKDPLDVSVMPGTTDFVTTMLLKWIFMGNVSKLCFTKLVLPMSINSTIIRLPCPQCSVYSVFYYCVYCICSLWKVNYFMERLSPRYNLSKSTIHCDENSLIKLNSFTVLV